MFLSSSSSCLLNVSVFFGFLHAECSCLLSVPAYRMFLPTECSCLPNVPAYRMFLSSSCSCLSPIPTCIVCYLTCVPTCLRPLYLPVWCSDLLNVLVKLISFLLPIAELVCLFCVLTGSTHHVFLCLLRIPCWSLILLPPTSGSCHVCSISPPALYILAPFPRLPPVPISAYHLYSCLLLMAMCFFLLFFLPFAWSVTPLLFAPSCSWFLNMPAISLFSPVFKGLLHFFACSVVNALPAANFCLHFLSCLPGDLAACQAFLCFSTCHTRTLCSMLLYLSENGPPCSPLSLNHC